MRAVSGCGVSSEHCSGDGNIIESLYINAVPSAHKYCPLDPFCFIMQKLCGCLRAHGAVKSYTASSGRN